MRTRDLILVAVAGFALWRPAHGQSPDERFPCHGTEIAHYTAYQTSGNIQIDGRLEEASWQAAEMCMQTHGGFGFAEEFDVERKFRESRLFTIAPISNNMVLNFVSEHVLGMPRSY